MEPLRKGHECLFKVAKFGPLPCIVLYKLCIFTPHGRRPLLWPFCRDSTVFSFSWCYESVLNLQTGKRNNVVENVQWYSGLQEKWHPLYQKLHKNYAKRTLDLSKFAIDMTVQGELARFPSLHKVWGLAIKYWFRLWHGISDILLNETF